MNCLFKKLSFCWCLFCFHFVVFLVTWFYWRRVFVVAISLLRRLHSLFLSITRFIWIFVNAVFAATAFHRTFLIERITSATLVSAVTTTWAALGLPLALTLVSRLCSCSSCSWMSGVKGDLMLVLAICCVGYVGHWVGLGGLHWLWTTVCLKSRRVFSYLLQNDIRYLLNGICHYFTFN